LLYSCNEASSNLKDVWLYFIAPQSGSVRIFGEYQLFSGTDCNNLVEVACSSNDTPANLVPKDGYYLRIVDNGRDDECSTASEIILTEEMQSLNLMEESISVSDQPYRTGIPYPDVWKSFTTGSTGNVVINSHPDVRFSPDLKVEIWEDCNGT